MSGRGGQAANISKDCAEKLEEDFNYEDAIKFFESAAQYYGTDNQASQQNTMLVKAADLSVLAATEGPKQVDFGKLIKTYEKVGNKYLSQNLVKTAAKDFFFKSALCYFANEDEVGGRRAIDKYQFDDPSFDGSRQHKFLNSVCAACEARDADMFSKTVQEYVKYSPLDKVNTKLIVWAKRHYCPEE